MVVSKAKEKPLTVNSEDAAQPNRGHWGGRFDFLLACIGNVVGLGNVWRFPYLCYRNGGGAFLIPYILMVFLVGLPVFLVELAIGQYSAMGPLKAFVHLAPLFKGIGYATIIASALVAVYYNMIMAWTVFYLFNSFRQDMPWQHCNHTYNTNNCFSDRDYRACKLTDEGNAFVNRTCYNATYASALNLSDIASSARVSPPEEYFNMFMLAKSEGIHQFGSIKWDLLLCLFGSWAVVVFCLIKGIKSSGKVVYFTATFPYVILIILFIRGITLEGAVDGISFYLVPDFSTLKEISVWQDAAIQVFYSFSIASGGMITYASYNKFQNDLLKDVWIVGIGDMLTSLFSGLVVFTMLGFMAKQLETDVPSVVQSGTGLAFIAYPDAISRMPFSFVWAVLFFFMLFLLGIDSQFALVETLLTYVFDQFPRTRRRKPVVVILLGLGLFLLGIPLATNGGFYLLEVMNEYAAGWPFLVIGLLECLVIAYVYGVTNFFRDLEEMVGWSPGNWVRSHLTVTLMTLAPSVIAIILVMSWVNYTPLSVGSYQFPMWGNAIGWVMAVVPVVAIPLAALSEFCTKFKSISFRQKLRTLTTPTIEWRANARQNAPITHNAIPNLPFNVAYDSQMTACYDNHALDVITRHNSYVGN